MTPETPVRFVTRENLTFEAQPWCDCEWLCRPDVVSSQQLLLVRASMPAGQGHQFHCHPGSEELIYVLEGLAEQWVGREHRVLGPAR